jgi:hypothetical protein
MFSKNLRVDGMSFVGDVAACFAATLLTGLPFEMTDNPQLNDLS